MPGVYGMVNRMPPAVAGGGGDTSLLAGETDGLAIDFTASTYFNSSTWAQLWNQVRTASVDTLSSPHVFYTQAGTSPKVVKTSATGLGWSPHNTAPRSQEFSNASWAKNSLSVTADTIAAPDGSTTADTLTATSTSDCQASVVIDFGGVVVSAVAYNYSVYAKAKTSSWICLSASDETAKDRRVWFDLTNGAVGGSTDTGGTILNGTPSITSVGSGWYRCSFSCTYSYSGANAHMRVFVVDADNSVAVTNGRDVYCWGAQANRGIVPTSYIATTSAAVNGLPISYSEGLLVEPAASNITTNSASASDAGYSVGSTVSLSTGVTAPDGSTTGLGITATAGIGTHHIFNAVASGFTAGSTYTKSVFVKNGTARYVGLAPTAGAGDYAYAIFDLQALTVTQTGGLTSSHVSSAITAIGSGWYRISLTLQAGQTTVYYPQIAMYSTGTPTVGTLGTETWAAAGTETFSFWGPQLETGPVATSYIPTLGSTVTRAIDDVRVALAAFPFSTSAGTVGCKFYPQVWDTSRYLWLLGTDTTGTPHVGSFSFYFAVWGDAGSITDAGDPTPNADNVSKAAFTSGDTRHWLNAATADNADTFTLVDNTTLTLGRRDSGGSPDPMIGFVKKFVYVPRRVSNGSLPTWSFT